MPARRWQARLEIGDHHDPAHAYRSICIYGETTDALHTAVRESLLRQKLVRFRNLGDHIAGRMTYFYSPGGVSRDVAFFRVPYVAKGWWYQREMMMSGRIQESKSSPPEKLESFEVAVDHFITYALIPEKGPDYQSRAMVGSQLRLPLVEKVLREDVEDPINDLIQRGWHIIALEYKGELSMTGELMNRRAIFVMGHPEVHAALLTLNADYYKKR